MAACGQQLPWDSCRKLGGGPLMSLRWAFSGWPQPRSPTLQCPPATPKRMTNTGFRSGTKTLGGPTLGGSTPHSPEDKNLARPDPPLQARSARAWRGVYCVKRPIVQSKDRTDRWVGEARGQGQEDRGGQRGGSLPPTSPPGSGWGWGGLDSCPSLLVPLVP